jgi:shikimate dehydrogenase
MIAYAEVIGDPISHSKSPLIHNFWLAKLGIDAEYRATHVRPDQLATYFAQRRQDVNWRGCNVTIPHKETAAAMISVQLAGYPDFGAINVVVPRGGDLWSANTDVDGIVGTIKTFHDHAFNFGAVPKRSIAIVGAGGAARAAIYAVKNLPFAASWRILVRRPEQGKTLARQMEVSAQVVPIAAESLKGVDILINASPLGMVGKPPLDLDLDQMGSGIGQPLVFEMVYSPLETPLTMEARQREFAVIDGLDMLIGQASGAFHHFFGQKVPSELIDATRDKVLSA